MSWLWASLALGASFSTALDLPELANRAERVFAGEVTSMQQETGPDGLPWTVATVEVESTFRGPVSSTVELSWPGGMLDDEIEMRVSGTPRVSEGDRLLIFERGGQPVALSQGVLHFQDDQHLWTATHLEFADHSEPPAFYALDEVLQALDPD
ncbi:MAG: hypothetical protein VX899_02080 [Myxococcota bacterium]|nr:hypothetical protein [Myxococcota bacterium]